MHSDFLNIGHQISVVIPALNEQKTVAKVVEVMKSSQYVGEVIVVDNGSDDLTAEKAKEAGAYVVLEAKIGYGRAVKRGVNASKYPWILKIDADIANPTNEWIEKLVKSTDDELKFVKGWWQNRQDPMPVTNLVAKPCLKKFFPELSHIHMPLSGIYLIHKDIVNNFELKDDWSYDIGLLISAAKQKETISQEHLGEVIDTLKPVSSYIEMSFELISYVTSNQKKHFKKYLFVMAHADDAEIWCGGTILKALANGHEVKLIIATTDDVRDQEATQAISLLKNVELTIMNNVEFDKISRPKNISFLADFIEEYSPDILISHHRSDVHPDHAECNKLCNAALLKIPRNLFPNEFYMCQSYYGDLQNSVSFEPTTFVDISDVAKIKYEILSQYKSQDYQFWIKMITAMDDLNGLKTGVKKAEAFQQSPAFSGHARPYL